MEVKGYKVFNSDWTCRNKKYTCPGFFEENVTPSVCEKGMHFCKKAANCFNYYGFDPKNHVAEVIAHGVVAESGDKCSTNRLEIVREIPWDELLELVNVGDQNVGRQNVGSQNVGSRNVGNWNVGDQNVGSQNVGSRNVGSWNVGSWNVGSWNVGNWNVGDQNVGSRNVGNWNVGSQNVGDRNVGRQNVGSRNVGNWNVGSQNVGSQNVGDRNVGRQNVGSQNVGSWNKTNCSTGIFNTKEQPITMFNRPSGWSYSDWEQSEANFILNKIPHDPVVWIWAEDMTEEEKSAHPEHETVGGYLKEMDLTDNAEIWWRGLTDKEKETVMSLPNFDKVIFKEITGIDVDKD